MSSQESISVWLDQLKRGDRAAVPHLVERYLQHLVTLARSRLQRMGTPRRTADEEDVALSALGSFIRRTEEGEFPDLEDRKDLWRLLVVITVRKAINLDRATRRQPEIKHAAEAGAWLEQVMDREPTPELLTQLADEWRHLLDRLDDPAEGDPQLRQVAEWMLEGYTVKEIAARLDCTTRTVERRLRVIRSLLAEEVGRE